MTKVKELISVKKIILLMFMAFMLISFMPNRSYAATVVASGTCEQNPSLAWSLDSDGVMTITGSGRLYPTTAVTPDLYSHLADIREVSIQGTSVRLRNGAFEGWENMEKISLGAGVTDIDKGAFDSSSKLATLTIDSGNEYFRSADNVLIAKEVYFEPGYGDVLFYYPQGLTNTNYTVPSGIQHIDSDSFSGQTHVKTVVLGNDVKTLETGAFENSSLENITLNNGLTSIAINSFANTALSSINLPASVTDATSAFLSTPKLTSFTVAAGNANFSAKDGVLLSKDGKTMIAYPSGKAGSDIAVPSGVTAIGAGACSYNQQFTRVTIPNTVTSIGANAFIHCDNIVEVYIGTGITAFNNFTFAPCAKLKSVYFYGNSPSVLSLATSPKRDFPEDAVIYFLESKSGWTSPWNGYNADTWSGQQTYKVSYNANGGSLPPNIQEKVPGVPLTLTSEVPGKSPSFSITYNGNGGRVQAIGDEWPQYFASQKCVLQSWNTKADGTGTSYAIGAVYNIDASVVLYAQWGVATGSLCTATRDGYTFAGWYTAMSGGTLVTEETFLIANIDLYAHWNSVGPVGDLSLIGVERIGVSPNFMLNISISVQVKRSNPSQACMVYVPLYDPSGKMIDLKILSIPGDGNASVTKTVDFNVPRPKTGLTCTAEYYQIDTNGKPLTDPQTLNIIF